MKRYELPEFGVDCLHIIDAPEPQPGPDEVVIEVQALSLNYRDLLVIEGKYNPALELPVTPISDAAGRIVACGSSVADLTVGTEVMTHFVAPWQDGPYDVAYLKGTLGTPGPGMAAERVALPASAVLPIPTGYSLAEAATLPIAALTAWSCLRTVASLESSQTVLTLGTGGVSIFALQLAKAMGATVIITSSSDEKLERCRELGADHTINYRTHENWSAQVLDITAGVGVDLAVEMGGPGTLDQSMKSTRGGGTIALPGALTGRKGEITTGLLLMRRLHLAGIMVDSKAAFRDMIAFIEQHQIRPIVDARFAFEALPQALEHMRAARHFGKIVVGR